MDEQPSATRFLVLGGLETILNQTLELSPATRQRLAPLHGTVVRVRMEKPMAVLYILIYEDGLEIMQDFEGHVDVRVRAPLGALLQWVLSPGAHDARENIRMLGPDELVLQLGEAMAAFSIWDGIRQWLESHVQLDQLLAMLRREDPAWLSQLHGLPAQMQELNRELARQRLLQEDILHEIRALKSSLGRERRLDLFCLVAGLFLLLGALATASGDLPMLVPDEGPGMQMLLLASAGLALVFSRILFGHRYD